MKSHYYEAHITLDVDDRLDEFKKACSYANFRPAKLLMQKTRAVSDLDMFCTARNTSLPQIVKSVVLAVTHLTALGFVVRRYKIESTLIDSKDTDELGLMG